MRRSLPLAGALVAAAVFTSPALSANAAPEPVPSLTPAATASLWEQLVDRPPLLSFSAACMPVRAVFYAGTDWIRLATKLAANASPCAQYYVSVPPLAGNKTQFRTDQAWRIRALGLQFHALAEVNVTGWSDWVAANGQTWYAAGQEARRRMAAAGYDVSAGDTWVVNELSSAVRQGIGNARANMRSFVRGLHDGDGTVPAARGAVFVIGMSQATAELSVYQSRLQDWYEDAPFWNDMSAYVSDWSQEVYGDVRNWAVPGTAPATRATSLNDYLQHEIALARVAPSSGAAATSFLSSAYNPLANAAWAYQEAFGWTDVQHDLMQSYVSSQVSATRSYDGSRFGFAWAPKNLHTLAPADFNAQTGAILDRMAAAIAGADACAPSWCGGDLAGAAFNGGWQRFATWRPSVLAFTTAPQTITAGGASGPLMVEQRTSTGVAYAAGLPVSVTFASSSTGGSFSTSASGPWTPTLTAAIPSGADSVSVHYRDTRTGSPTITASASGKAAATQVETISSPDTGDPILLAAGDIAACDSPGDEATAAILDGYPDATVAALGDNVYPNGTAADFASCYGPSWGRHKARTKPSAGNHEYLSADATPYFDYFGAAAGPRGKGWYSYELGDWHVVVLNSNCEFIECGPGSEQEQWLRSELAASEAACTLAYWHHPLFTSGAHAGEANLALVRPFWQALYEYGADVVLVGHDHDYERFAPQKPNGAADPVYGLRQFVVGTGGRSLRPFGPTAANSEVRDNSAFGVLHLVLRSGGYDWQFLPEAGKTFSDTGSGTCHAAPDQTAAGNPTLSSTHPSGWSNDRTVDVTWSGASDGGSGVDGYSYEWSQAPATVPNTTKDAEETATGTTSPELADGEWWFHLRTGDNAGNWSAPVHLGPFRIDATAPANPALSSPSHTVGAWSNDPTVDAMWSGPTDPHSGVDGFSYEWSQSAATTPDTTKDAEETAAGTTSPALADGSSWLHLRTRDNAGNWSAAAHLGPFTIDATAAGNPVPASSTHSIGDWSSDATVDVTWSGATDARSGVDGFSYEWSQSAGTVPDTTKDAEETAAGVTSPQLPDGESWFHVRTRDNAGNWSAPVHLGPFRIDASAPANPALSSLSHMPGDWSNDPTVDVAWSGATDPHSGVDGFSYAWTQSDTTTPDTAKDAQETAAGTTSPELADGDWWFHLRTRDNVGNWSGAVHRGPFRIDTTAPTNPTLSSPSHAVGAWSSTSTVVIVWASGPDVDGYSYEWSQTAATAPDEVKDAEESTTSVASPRPDGSWWFHLRTRVDTGAWSHPAHVGPFRIDATPPSSPLAWSSSHTPATPSTDRTVDVVWQADDSPSGVAGYSIAWSSEPSTVPDTATDTAVAFMTSAELADGAWWFHVRARDGAGSWGAPTHLGPFHIETPPPPQLEPPAPQPQPPLQPQPPPPPPEPPPPGPPPPPPLLQPPIRPSSCDVPRLAGRTLKQSRTLIARGRCRLGRVGRAFSIRVPKGRVVVQRPRARLRLARGARVNLTLSRGRRPGAR